MGAIQKAMVPNDADAALASFVALSGSFDDRIKALVAAKEAAAPYLEIAATVERAQEIEAAAKQKAIEVGAELDARAAALAQRSKDLDAIAAGLAQREGAVKTAETALESDRSDFARYQAGQTTDLTQRRDRLAAKEAEFQSRSDAEYSSIAASKAKIDGEREALNADIAAHAAEHAEKLSALSAAEQRLNERIAAFEKESSARQTELDGLERDLREKLAA